MDVEARNRRRAIVLVVLALGHLLAIAIASGGLLFVCWSAATLLALVGMAITDHDMQLAVWRPIYQLVVGAAAGLAVVAGVASATVYGSSRPMGVVMPLGFLWCTIVAVAALRRPTARRAAQAGALAIAAGTVLWTAHVTVQFLEGTAHMFDGEPRPDAQIYDKAWSTCIDVACIALYFIGLLVSAAAHALFRSSTLPEARVR